MAETPHTYQLDYDWLWNNPTGNDGSSATVLMHLTGEQPLALACAAAWLTNLPKDSSGIRGQGGWRADLVAIDSGHIILSITSAGEDVAEGIEAGTQDAFHHLERFENLRIDWQQLPRAQELITLQEQAIFQEFANLKASS